LFNPAPAGGPAVCCLDTLVEVRSERTVRIHRITAAWTEALKKNEALAQSVSGRRQTGREQQLTHLDKNVETARLLITMPWPRLQIPRSQPRRQDRYLLPSAPD